MIRLFSVLLLLCLGVTIAAAPVSAQDEPALIATLRSLPQPSSFYSLSEVPTDGMWAGTLMYTDLDAMTAARGAIDFPGSVSELDQVPEDDAALFMQGVLSGVRNYAMERYLLADPVRNGFSWADVSQVVTFGDPQSSGLLFRGNFDPFEMVTVREAAGYQVVESFTDGEWVGESGEAFFLCSVEGCESGDVPDPANPRDGDPLYGDLGIRSPIFVNDTIIAASRQETIALDVPTVLSGASESLLDDPNYRTAAEALSMSGTVTQAMFAPSVVVGPMIDVAALMMGTGSDFDPAMIETAAAERGLQVIPYYSLLAFAGVSDEASQSLRIALVYPTAEEAQAAAEILPTNIANYELLAMRQPLADRLTQMGLGAPQIEVFTSDATGYSAAVITWNGPRPLNQRGDFPAFFPTSDMPYIFAYQMMSYRDLGWLAFTF